MGRHSNADTTVGLTARPTGRREIATAIRAAAPTPPPAGGLDVATLSLRPASPVATAVPTTAPAARLGWRERRAARQEQAAQAALAARLSRAERRTRQVSAAAPTPVAPVVPAPRSPDPSVSGPLAIGVLATARPPWGARSPAGTSR